MGFHLVEFEERGNQTLEYKFQLNEEHQSDNMRYDMIIGNYLLWNMSLDIRFSEETVNWDSDKIQLKTNGAIQQKEICKMLYSMHVESPIIKEAKERTDWILDSVYLKVDINTMVIDGLNIHRNP